MTLRVTTVPEVASRPVRALCEPAEAAARMLVIGALVFGLLHLAIDSTACAAGWIGPVGRSAFWIGALLTGLPGLTLLWFTRLPRWKVAVANGLVLAAVLTVLKGILPLAGVGKGLDFSRPGQAVLPVLYSLAAFGGVLLTSVLSRAVGADLRRP